MAGIARRLPWTGAARRADLQERQWRRVPRISVVPAQRRTGFPPSLVALAVVLLVELFLVQSYYRGIQTLTDDVEAATVSLDQVAEELGSEETAVGDLEIKIAAVEEKMAQVSARRQQIADSRKELEAPRTDWALALRLLLDADGPDVNVTKLVVDPAGSIELTGSFSTPTSFVRFQEHMNGVSDVLELGSLKQDGPDFTASIGVK